MVSNQIEESRTLHISLSEWEIETLDLMEHAVSCWPICIMVNTRTIGRISGKNLAASVRTIFVAVEALHLVINSLRPGDAYMRQ